MSRENNRIAITGIYHSYERHRRMLENIVFPALLLLYPFAGIRQGLDVSDATYSLANFQYFPSMDGTWIVATFLANAAGHFLMQLPFGSTLIGMYCYTALIQSATALIAYFALRRRIPAPLVFIGEVIALGLCWCPSITLYNYLTYLLMTAGILLLHKGILHENNACAADCPLADGTKQGGVPKYYVLAGICLGANVAVRMPNVVQAALIVAVWYGVAVCGQKNKWQRTVRDTLWCMLGYIIGFGVPFSVICIRYGVTAYPSMVQTMFAMTEKATDYQPASMLTGMFRDYLTGSFWLLFAGACMAGGWFLCMIQRRFFAGIRYTAGLCRLLYAAALLVLLRFYWGKGVFTFRYYQYSSMYYPAVLLLIVTILMAAFCLWKQEMPAACRIAAVLVLVQILVTPLGSNNILYPIINNMFVVVPFVLWTGHLLAKNSGVNGMVWKAPFVVLVVFVLVQSVGFHLNYAFQDGVEGEKRDTVVTVPGKAAGVCTVQDNAVWLSELAEYVQEEGLTGKRALFYGDIPGLGYLLDMPPALSTFWPDLDSYRMAEYERDLERMEEPPVVIVSSPVAAYLSEDADGMNWFGVDQAKMDGDEKLQILKEYLHACGYEETFGNGLYVVLQTDFRRGNLEPKGENIHDQF